MSKLYLGLAVVASLAVVGVASWFARKGAAGAAAAVGKAAADAVGGVVVGIGESVGIPQTNMTECDKALAEGRTWDASFACPAGTFFKSFFGSSPAAPPSTAAGSCELCDRSSAPEPVYVADYSAIVTP